MTQAEDEICELMKSTQRRCFPELTNCVFQVEKRDIDGVEMRVVFNTPAKVFLYYGDNRVLETKYRMGLIPIIAHELGHLVDPVDPERVMEERLPASVMELWGYLCDEGYAACSMSSKHKHTRGGV